MAEKKHTRCPSCATVYRVTAEQLATRTGQVRCGRCKTVFNGVAEQVLFEAADPGEDAHERNMAMLAAPKVTARTFEGVPRIPTEPDGTRAGNAVPGNSAEVRMTSAPERTSGRAKIVLYAVALVVFVATIMAQAGFHFRDPIVAYWPAARPAMARLCDVAGCAIRPLRDPAMSHLSIEASDLQADPAHRGLLILSATLRNRATWSVAYPYLELTLTDAQDRVVVRRALAPVDYAGGTADVQRGIGPNGEIAMKVFIDASATAQAGYRLYMFYP
jgi:predicted Zn finger-like uncharacterized protein